MTNVVTLAGSPSLRSRSSGLLAYTTELVKDAGLQVRAFGLADFPAEVLLQAQFSHPSVRAFIDAVAESEGLIVATPVYKAAYSGLLKIVLDLLPERALSHHAVLPLATGGSPAHLLAVDYSLQPVLTALKARHILGGVYATEADLRWTEQGLEVTDPIQERLRQAVNGFLAHLPNPERARIHPSQLNTQILASKISI